MSQECPKTSAPQRQSPQEERENRRDLACKEANRSKSEILDNQSRDEVGCHTHNSHLRPQEEHNDHIDLQEESKGKKKKKKKKKKKIKQQKTPKILTNLHQVRILAGTDI